MSKSEGAICGGVVKESVFMKEPMDYMMAHVMPDKHFEKYVRAMDAKDDKTAKQLFDKYAWSAI